MEHDALFAETCAVDLCEEVSLRAPHARIPARRGGQGTSCGELIATAVSASRCCEQRDSRRP